MIILMKFGHLANEKTKIPKHKNLQEFVTAHEKGLTRDINPALTLLNDYKCFIKALPCPCVCTDQFTDHYNKKGISIG